MRLATFSYGGTRYPGAVRGEEIIRLDSIAPDLLSLVEAGPEALTRAAALAAKGVGLPLTEIELLAPFPTPRRNVFCLGQNYLEHAREINRARNEPFKIPTKPTFFTKATTTVTGPFADVPINEQVSPQMDWEVELGIVIGRQGKDISREDAAGYILGYLVLNDVSARDLQMSFGGQYFKGKSLDRTCPMGPWIVTRDEIPDPHGLRIICRVNGVTKQDSTTGELMFRVPDILYWLSLGMTLLPGDIIATGTPSGVGLGRTPPEFLRPGDLVESEIEGVGVLRNRVISD